MYSTSARQDEAGDEVGGGECFLRSTRDLQKLIECVVLKQTEDQYVVAAMWDQYRQVYNSQQGTLSNTLYYESLRTKFEVAESVGCVFANDRTREYCAQDEFKTSYDSLRPDEKAKVDDSARERFIAYGLLQTSGKDHDHLKHALSDDFAKGGDTYPKTPQQRISTQRLLLSLLSRRVPRLPRRERRRGALRRSRMLLIPRRWSLTKTSTRIRSVSVAEAGTPQVSLHSEAEGC